MNGINMFDICQAHLPVQCASNIKLNARRDTVVVIDSEPHPSRMCKTSLLFAWMAVRVHAGCSTFLFYTLIKPLIWLNIKYKIVLSPKL